METLNAPKIDYDCDDGAHQHDQPRMRYAARAVQVTRWDSVHEPVPLCGTDNKADNNSRYRRTRPGVCETPTRAIGPAGRCPATESGLCIPGWRNRCSPAIPTARRGCTHIYDRD